MAKSFSILTVCIATAMAACSGSVSTTRATSADEHRSASADDHASTSADEHRSASADDHASTSVATRPTFTWLVGTEDEFCALDTSRRVWCQDLAGRARQLRELPAVDELVGSDSRFCARSGNVVRCWVPGFAPRDVAALAGARAITLYGDVACAALSTGPIACDGPSIRYRSFMSSMTNASDLALFSDGSELQICALDVSGGVQCEGCAFDWSAFDLAADVPVSRRHSGTRCTQAPVATRDRGVRSLDWVASGATRVVSEHGSRLAGVQNVRDCRDAPCRVRHAHRAWVDAQAAEPGSIEVRMAAGAFALVVDGSLVRAEADSLGPVEFAATQTTTTTVARLPPSPPGPYMVSASSSAAYVLQADGAVTRLDEEHRHVRVDVPVAAELSPIPQVGVLLRSGTEVWLASGAESERLVSLEPAIATTSSGRSLCSVTSGGTIACLGMAGHRDSCLGIGSGLVDVAMTNDGEACVLDGSGHASCGRGTPCEAASFATSASGVARLELREPDRISLVDAAGAVISTYPRDSTTAVYWCLGAPCRCAVEENELWCLGPNEPDDPNGPMPRASMITEVVMATENFALRADGSLTRWESVRSGPNQLVTAARPE